MVFQDGQILLVQRDHEPLKGWWSLPGGALETGETIENGLRREIREETGLEIEVLGLFEAFDSITRDAEGRAEYHYVLFDYLCRPASGTVAAASDASNAEWVEESRLANYRIAEGTLAVIRRAFVRMKGEA